jgi:flagellar basal-body rod protein FlgB
LRLHNPDQITELKSYNQNWHSICFLSSEAVNRDAPHMQEATMPIGDKMFGVHETALKLRSQRMAVLASNIANAATPNYKARDFDFEAALKAAGQGMAPELEYRVPLQASLDGNTVELATEQTAFAENAIGYRASLTFLNSRIGSMMRALKGE